MSLGFIIILIGMFGMMIFMFNHELFVKPKAFRIILILSLITLALAYILPHFDIFKNTHPGAFKFPIITLVYYRILSGLLKKYSIVSPRILFR